MGDNNELTLEKAGLEKKIKLLEVIQDKLSKEKESLDQTNSFLKV